MKKKINPLVIMIGLICILVLIMVALIAIILDGRSPNPVLGIFRNETTAPTEETQLPTQETTEPSEPADVTKPTYGPEKPPVETEPPAETPETPTVRPEDPTVRPEDPTVRPEDPSTPSDKPPVGPEDPTVPPELNPEEPVSPDVPVTPPEILPPEVVIPPVVDPETGTESVSFPCQVPGYDLTIEKLAPYNGIFVENGTNVPVESVAMLMVRNDGDFPVEYMQIGVQYGEETLLFDVSGLPIGATLVAQEATGKPLPTGTAGKVTAMVVQRAELEMSQNQVQVIDNGDNTLTIQNLTNKTIPTVRIFYKYYMKQEGVYVGGIAFTVRVTRLGPGASITIQPSHYTSQTSRVVMVLTYDTEV